MVFSKRFGKEFAEMERQMGRMLRTTSLARMIQMQSGSDWQPAVDVYETEDEIYVCVDTAGIDLNNMSVSIAKNTVIVSGNRQFPTRKNLCRVHQLEIEHGFFERTISFPVPVDVTDLSSRCVNGILEIRLPKK
jgi:HSP20 family protein